MSYTTINKSTDYFNTKLYTGNNNTSQNITGVGFQPDFIWIKNRDNTERHHLADVIRGDNKFIHSDSSDAERTGAYSGSNTQLNFASDGFNLVSNGNGDELNFGSRTYASWNWKANGSGSSNTDGSITSTVSANTTAGFSIVTYTGNATAGATIGHGLGVVPKMIIAKKLNGTPNWGVYHVGMGSPSKYLELNTTASETTDNAVWDGATPTSSVFYVGSDNKVNGSGGNYVAYCFAEKTGYSKFGSYVGNGSADGTFVYTGFKPAMTIHKNITTSATYWRIFDNKRSSSGANVIDRRLFPQTNEAEDSTVAIDYYSNGFKMRGTSSAENASGATYIYMAFASAPLVGSNNVPCTAR